MPIKYIGRTTDFKGKTLWEILGNLKNFGVGRIVVRNMFQRYPEVSYMKVLKVGALPVVEAQPNAESRKVMVLVERVFRGRKEPKIVQIDSTTYKADYLLIPKDQEYKYKPSEETKEILLPQTGEFPPLMKELIIRRLKAKGASAIEEPKLPMFYNKLGNKITRVAKDGETPTVNITVGLGKPASPSLYTNIKN